MQELIKSSFFWFLRGDGSGISIITQKNRAEARFSRTLLFYFYFLGFVFVFSFKCKPKDPIL